MKTTLLYAASSQRTGSGEWRQWTVPKCEGLGALLCLWVRSRASPGCDRASPPLLLDCHCGSLTL